MRLIFRFIRASAKSIIDLVSLMLLFPVLSVRYTVCRVALTIVLYSLRGLDCNNMPDIVSQVRVLFAEYPRKFLDRVIHAVQNGIIKVLNFSEYLYELAADLMGYVQCSRVETYEAMSTPINIT